MPEDKSRADCIKKKLVLTGFDEFWPKNPTQAYYLGTWCFTGREDVKFEDQRNYQIIPTPWKSSEKVQESVLYLNDLFDRLSPELQKFYNTWYGIGYSERFWKISLSTFTLRWLAVLYNYYLRLKMTNAFAREKGVHFEVEAIKGAVDRPKEDICFASLLRRHDYNLCLFSQVLKCMDFDNITVHFSDLSIQLSNKDFFVGPKKSTLKDELKEKLLPSSDVYLGSVYALKYFDKLLLSAVRKIKFGNHASGEWESITAKFSLEDITSFKLNFHPSNEFESLVSQLLLKNLPLHTLEQIPESPNKKRVRFWIGNDIYKSQTDAFQIARVIENQGKWYSAQHGGGYGYSSFNSEAKIEYDLSQNFISWGWNHKHIYSTNIVALPNVQLSSMKPSIFKNDKIIFTMTAYDIYFTKFCQGTTRRERLKYIDSRIKFIKKLPGFVKEKIIYKMYHSPCFKVVNEKEMLFKVLRKNQIHPYNGARNIEYLKYARKAKLSVTDYYGTSFLQALACNIPVINFFNAQVYSCTAESQHDFDELFRVGICLKGPEAAAEFVAENYHNISDWWNDVELQKVRREFVNKYARVSKAALHDWVRFISNLN